MLSYSHSLSPLFSFLSFRLLLPNRRSCLTTAVQPKQRQTTDALSTTQSSRHSWKRETHWNHLTRRSGSPNLMESSFSVTSNTASEDVNRYVCCVAVVCIQTACLWCPSCHFLSLSSPTSHPLLPYSVACYRFRSFLCIVLRLPSSITVYPPNSV